MEKRWLLIFAVVIMFASIFSVSAEMIFNQQPDAVYNLGDSITVPITIKAVSPVEDTVNII